MDEGLCETCSDTNMEGAEVLSYLVSCLGETAASHPGLATGTEECCFPGSWGAWGFQEPGSVGSYRAWGAGRGRNVSRKYPDTLDFLQAER